MIQKLRCLLGRHAWRGTGHHRDFGKGMLVHEQTCVFHNPPRRRYVRLGNTWKRGATA
jgi:hypothetical protein